MIAFLVSSIFFFCTLSKKSAAVHDLSGIRVTCQPLAWHRSLPQFNSSFSVNKRFVVLLAHKLCLVFYGLLSLESVLDRFESLRRDSSDAKTAIYYDREPCSVIVC